MRRRVIPSLVAVVVFAGLTLGAVSAGAQDSGVSRKVLSKEDLSAPGHEGVLAQVEFAPGAKESPHTHPGEVFVYQQEGTVVFHVEGKPDATLKTGDAYVVPGGKVHWAENTGPAPAKALAMFVVEKGKPLRSPAPAK